MYSGNIVLAQLLELLPFSHFEHLVDKFKANRYRKGFSAWSHLVCLLYAQLSRRDGLRDLVACLNAHSNALFHLGVRHRLSRSTLGDANEARDYQLFEALGHRLVVQAQALYNTPTLRLEPISPGPLQRSVAWELSAPLYAMDSSTVELCMALFPWAQYRRASAALKLHTIIDLRGAIPVLVSITEGKRADVHLLDEVSLPVGSFVVFDRGYLDFARFYKLVKSGCHFVTRAKSDMVFQTVQVRPIVQTQGSAEGGADKAGLHLGVQSDLIIKLQLYKSRRAYPKLLRRVRYVDADTAQELVFLSNRLDLTALQIAQLYKQRWRVELFFKWLKQHLCIKHFYGTSQNAVKSQIWCAICAYLLLLIAHKPHATTLSLHTFIHLIETSLFERITIADLVSTTATPADYRLSPKQSELF